MIRFQVLHTASEIDRVQKQWQRLAENPSTSIFQSFHWNRLVAEVFAESETPHVIVAEEAGEMAILPLAIRRDGTACLLGETLFDYREMLSTGDRRLEIATLFEACRLGHSLEITAVREESQERFSFLGLQPFCHAPRIDHQKMSGDQLLAEHRRLGRHSRRLRARGVEFHRHTGALSSLDREIYERKSQQEGSLFADPLRREFMQRVAAIEANHCKIFTYESSNELVAALVSFDRERCRYFYTVYFDQRWAEFSPGQVLLFEAAHDALELGLDCDFLTGEYPYKMRLATSAPALYRVHLTAAQWKAAMEKRFAQSAA